MAWDRVGGLILAGFLILVGGVGGGVLAARLLAAMRAKQRRNSGM